MTTFMPTIPKLPVPHNELLAPILKEYNARSEALLMGNDGTGFWHKALIPSYTKSTHDKLIPELCTDRYRVLKHGKEVYPMLPIVDFHENTIREYLNRYTDLHPIEHQYLQQLIESNNNKNIFKADSTTHLIDSVADLGVCDDPGAKVKSEDGLFLGFKWVPSLDSFPGAYMPNGLNLYPGNVNNVNVYHTERNLNTNNIIMMDNISPGYANLEYINKYRNTYDVVREKELGSEDSWRANSHTKDFDDCLAGSVSGSQIYTHVLGEGYNVDLTYLVHEAHKYDIIFNSLHNFMRDLYRITLAEARETNNSQENLLSFFGKHNLFDKRIASWLYCSKYNRRKLHNYRLDWEASLTTHRNLELQLAGITVPKFTQEGITDKDNPNRVHPYPILATVFPYTASKNLGCLLMPSSNPYFDKFLSGETDTVCRFNVKDYAFTWGSNLPHHNPHNALKTAKSFLEYTIVRTEESNLNPLGMYELTENSNPYRLKYIPKLGIDSNSFRYTFKPLISNNRVFKSSMILTDGTEEYLKSLSTVFTSIIDKHETKGDLQITQTFDDVEPLHMSSEAHIATECVGDVGRYNMSIYNNSVHLKHVPKALYRFIHALAVAYTPNKINWDAANKPKELFSTHAEMFEDFDVDSQIFGVPHATFPQSIDSEGDLDEYNYADEILTDTLFVNSQTNEPSSYTLLHTPRGIYFKTPQSYSVRTRIFMAGRNHVKSLPLLRHYIEIDWDANEGDNILNRNFNSDDSVNDWGYSVSFGMTAKNNALIPYDLANNYLYYGDGNNLFKPGTGTGNYSGSYLNGRTTTNGIAATVSNNFALKFLLTEGMESKDQGTAVSLQSLRSAIRGLYDMALTCKLAANVLTDYLVWRSEKFPDDTRMLKRLIKIIDICTKYGDTKERIAYANKIFTQIVGDPDDLLE